MKIRQIGLLHGLKLQIAGGNELVQFLSDLCVVSAVHCQSICRRWYYISVFTLLQIAGCMGFFFGTSSCHRAGSSAGFRSRTTSTVHESGHLHREDPERLSFPGQTARHACLTQRPCLAVCVRTRLLTGGVCRQTHTLLSSCVRRWVHSLRAGCVGSANANSLEFIGNPHLVMF